MTAVGELSKLVCELDCTALSGETLDWVKMHILDSVGAMLFGLQGIDGKAIKKLMQDVMAIDSSKNPQNYKAAMVPSIIFCCSAIRSTELDDIHLASCTTPGSIILPTAVSLAKFGYITSVQEFISAIIVGYEVLVRFGSAINGPAVLQRGIWPTYFSAPVGAAAVTARSLKLNQEQTVNALSTAFTFSSGTVIHPHGKLTSRWLTVGVAAQNGVIAGFAAQNGLTGNDPLMVESSEQFHGLPFYPVKLTEDLGKRFMINETSIKPYPIAYQGLAAVEAFREIVRHNRLQPQSIDDIRVMVPSQLIGVINRPTISENRLELISSLQYQIASAAVGISEWLDFESEKFSDQIKSSSIMGKVRIEASPELISYYPQAWPARVEVTTGGKRYSRELLYPRGDYRNQFEWRELIAKLRKVICNSASQIEIDDIVNLIENLENLDDLSRLVKLLKY